MDLNKTYDTWRQAVSDPNRFFSKFKAKPDLSTAVQWAAIGGVVSVFISQLALLAHAKTDVASALVGTIVSGAILVPLLLLVFSGVLLMFAKLLGGKGSYDAQTYAMALIQSPMSIVMALVAFVFDILYAPAAYAYGVPVRTGIVGAVYGFASFALMLYVCYAMVIAFRNIHNYSTMRAVATFLLPAAIFAVLAVLAVMFFTVAGISSMAA